MWLVDASWVCCCQDRRYPWWLGPVQHIVDITNLDGVLFPEEPEPEFVSISDDNLDVVTLEENNAIAIIDFPTKADISSLSSGSTDIDSIDTEVENIIDQLSSLISVPRETDGVIFINSEHFVAADKDNWFQWKVRPVASKSSTLEALHSKEIWV